MQRIEYAGYHRCIISRNPRRFDEDGDELDDEDVDEQADAAAVEDNPFGEIKLEREQATSMISRSLSAKMQCIRPSRPIDCGR